MLLWETLSWLRLAAKVCYFNLAVKEGLQTKQAMQLHARTESELRVVKSDGRHRSAVPLYLAQLFCFIGAHKILALS
jgi:hypothetical protein